jgi:hypothetical protein
LVVLRARERGCALDATDVEVALNNGSRAWMRQWIDP